MYELDLNFNNNVRNPSQEDTLIVLTSDVHGGASGFLAPIVDISVVLDESFSCVWFLSYCCGN